MLEKEDTRQTFYFSKETQPMKFFLRSIITSIKTAAKIWPAAKIFGKRKKNISMDIFEQISLF